MESNSGQYSLQEVAAPLNTLNFTPYTYRNVKDQPSNTQRLAEISRINFEDRSMKNFGIQNRLIESSLTKPSTTTGKNFKHSKTKLNIDTFVNENEGDKLMENRYKRLIELGIPLTMLPPIFPRLTLPTKAMPPMKNILTIEHVNEILKKADVYEKNGLNVKFVRDQSLDTKVIRFVPILADCVTEIIGDFSSTQDFQFDSSRSETHTYTVCQKI